MSLTSYRAAPSRATNEATFLSPGSLFCFPFCFRKTAAGCSIPRHQLSDPFLSPGSLFCFPFCFRKTAAGCSIPRHQLSDPFRDRLKRKKADIRRMNDSGPPFEL
ncbi:hypothetical protein [Sphingorhabdus sp.]|uniref:hypothetical protein n=1 Tax=Sphingorhabdus sp. TaxID=1902408 RepID=UPI0037CC8143